MNLLSHELVEGPLGVVVSHLGQADRARLALTCRTACAAVLAVPVEQELHVADGHLASFNTWLVRRAALPSGAGPVRAVRLECGPNGRAIATVCHLAHCGTQHLALANEASPALLEAACSIGTLTSLRLSVSMPVSSLQPLSALRQLRSLQLFIQGGRGPPPTPAACSLRLPSLTTLLVGARFAPGGPLTIALDGCPALQRLSLAFCEGVTVAAGAPLRQVTRLGLWNAEGLQVPWEQLPELRELTVQPEASIDLLEGATQLTALRSLLVDARSLGVPRGHWLAGVSRLVLEGFQTKKDPRQLNWLADARAVEELVLCVEYRGLEGQAVATQHLGTAMKWASWAAGLPRLCLLELWAGRNYANGMGRNPDLLCTTCRAEGEDVEGMVGRVLLALGRMLLERGG